MRPVLRNTRKTGLVSSAPRSEPASSLIVSRRASAPFALWMFLAFALGAFAGREGNFTIRFEPTAVLQTDTQIPFTITVTNDLHQPLHEAKVTLQIETKDHQNVKLFKAPEVASGEYVAKPIFPAPGEWSVYVEVQRNDQMSSRTLEYTVPK